jgi:hypothetical protein
MKLSLNTIRFFILLLLVIVPSLSFADTLFIKENGNNSVLFNQTTNQTQPLIPLALDETSGSQVWFQGVNDHQYYYYNALSVPSSNGYQASGPESSAPISGITGKPFTPAAPNENDGVCWKGFWGGLDIGNCLSQGGYWFLYLLSRVLVLVGILFGLIIQYTVIGMADFVHKIPAINIGWKAFRDIANLTFIFILLYISIATILRLNGYDAKSLLVKLIIAALLINFSLFFTKVIIDASNILALTFYKNITTTGQQAEPVGALDTGSNLGNSFMSAFGLQGIAPTADQAREAFAQSSHTFVLSVVGSIFILVGIFVFIAACVLFLIRFGLLVFLMVLSPLAFAGSILPRTASYAKKFWSTLISESFFAPVFMIMIWFALAIVTNDAFKSALGIGQGATLSKAIDNPNDPGAVGIVLSFGIIVVLLVASLIIAKQMGAYGGDRALKVFNGLRSRAQRGLGAATFGAAGLGLRYSAGRRAQRYLDSPEGKADQVSKNILSRVKYATQERLAKSSFDVRSEKSRAGKGGYEQIEKDRQKRIEEQNKRAGQMTISELAEADKLIKQKQLAKARQDEINADPMRKEQVARRNSINSKVEDTQGKMKKVENEIANQTALRIKAQAAKDSAAERAAEAALNKAQNDKTKLERDLRTVENLKASHGARMAPLDTELKQLDKTIEELDTDIKGIKSRGRVRQQTFLDEKERRSVFNLWMPPTKQAQMIRAEMNKSKLERAFDTLKEGLEEKEKEKEEKKDEKSTQATTTPTRPPRTPTPPPSPPPSRPSAPPPPSSPPSPPSPPGSVT